MAGRPYPHTKLVIRGLIGSTQTWSCGLGISTASVPTGAQLTTWLASIQSAAEDWWNGGTPDISTGVGVDTFLTQLEAYTYLAGQGSATAQGQYNYATPQHGANGNILSARDCLVASLETGLPGRSFRGRIYCPCNGMALTSHQAATGYVTNVATATANMITAINASSIGADPATVVILNNKDFPQPVTQVKVDSLPDTQRRREDKLGALFTHFVTV